MTTPTTTGRESVEYDPQTVADLLRRSAAFLDDMATNAERDALTESDRYGLLFAIMSLAGAVRDALGVVSPLPNSAEIERAHEAVVKMTRAAIALSEIVTGDEIDTFATIHLGLSALGQLRHD